MRRANKPQPPITFSNEGAKATPPPPPPPHVSTSLDITVYLGLEGHYYSISPSPVVIITLIQQLCTMQG